MLRNRIARVRAASLGLCGLLAMVVLGAASVRAGDDPIRQPIWEQAQAAAALDSLPVRHFLYQLLAFPTPPNPNTVSGIFDELGGYDVSKWRLGHWMPSLSGTNKYQEPPAFSSVRSGLGYWLISDSIRVRYTADPAPVDTVELPLIQGPNGAAEFNQLGNPYPFPTGTAVAGWRVVKRDSLLTLGQAASATWIDANMRVWNPDTKQYSASGTIGKSQGFFARITDPDTALKWTRWQVDIGPSVGYWSSVKLDSKGNPHIVYYVDGVGDLRYATRKNNTWTTQILDTNTDSFNGVWASIDLDSLDLPHVAYNTQFGGHAYYMREQTNGTWTLPEQIESTGNTGWEIKLKLFHGVPRVVYVDQGNNVMKYAEKTFAGWNIENVSSLLTGNVNFSTGDIGFDINKVTGVPHIVSPSPGFVFNSLRYATKVGTNWVTEVVDTLPLGTTGWTPSIAVDNAGNPHVAYFDSTDIDLKYAKRVGGVWNKETVDATGNTGQYSKVMVDANNVPSIAFLEFSSMGVPNRIKYARRLGGGWNIEVVDDVNVSSFFAFLGATLDPSGTPRVSYQGIAGNQQLRYAEKIRGQWRIKIPPVPAPGPALAATPLDQGASWALGITATQNGHASEPMFIGAAPNDAQASALRSVRLPAPPGTDVLSLHVPANGEDLVRSFQTPAPRLHWDLKTDGGAAPGEQTLSFEGLGVPAGTRFFLTDPEGGWTREVSPGGSMTLAAHPRDLELVATTDGSGPPLSTPKDGLQFAYPNPFAASTGLSFTLSRAGDIKVDLFDITGRRVRSIERAGASPGEHVLVWDGRDADGRSLPSGVYLARWNAAGLSGARRIVRVE